MVVAVDGPAGVGKSTVAARVAQISGFLYLNSGSFYRSISKAVLESGREPMENSSVIEIAKQSRFTLPDAELLLNAAPVRDLQTDLIDHWSPIHSQIPEVRAIVNKSLRRIAKAKNVIVEGRDIGSVAFPDADVKIFLDATIEARAARRFQQGVSDLNEAQVRKGLEERDHLDRNKPVGRLEKSRDAVYIDTSALTIEEVCDRVIGEIRKKQNQLGVNLSNELRIQE